MALIVKLYLVLKMKFNVLLEKKPHLIKAVYKYILKIKVRLLQEIINLFMQINGQAQNHGVVKDHL